MPAAKATWRLPVRPMSKRSGSSKAAGSWLAAMLHQQDAVAGLDLRAAQHQRLSRPTRRRPQGPVHPEDLLDRVADQLRLVLQAAPLVGIAPEGGDAVRDQVHRRLVAGEDEQHDVGHDLVLGEAVVACRPERPGSPRSGRPAGSGAAPARSSGRTRTATGHPPPPCGPGPDRGRARTPRRSAGRTTASPTPGPRRGSRGTRRSPSPAGGRRTRRGSRPAPRPAAPPPARPPDGRARGRSSSTLRGMNALLSKRAHPGLERRIPPHERLRQHRVHVLVQARVLQRVVLAPRPGHPVRRQLLVGPEPGGDVVVAGDDPAVPPGVEVDGAVLPKRPVEPARLIDGDVAEQVVEVDRRRDYPGPPTAVTRSAAPRSGSAWRPGWRDRRRRRRRPAPRRRTTRRSSRPRRPARAGRP